MKHTMQFSVGDEVANVPHDEMDEFNAVAKQNNVTPEPIFSYRVSGKDMEPQEVEVPKSQYDEFTKVAADNGAKIEPLRRLVFANGTERQFTGPELRKFMSGEYRTSPDYQADRDETAAKVRAKIGDDPQYTDYLKAQDPKSLAESVEGLKESFKGAAYMARKTVLPYVRAFLTAPMRLMGQAMASGVPMTPSITGGGVTFNPPKESGEAFKEIANGIEGAVAPSKEDEAWSSENGLSTVGKVEETAHGIGAFAATLHSMGPLAGNILMSATAGNDAYINRYDEQIQLGKSPEEASEAAARDGAIVTLGTAAMGAMPVSRVLKFGKAAPVIDATKGEIRNYGDLLRQAVDGNIKNWLINSGVATVEAAAISGGEAYLSKLSDFKAHGRELDGNAHLEALWDGAKEATETAGIVALMGGMQYGDYRRAIRDGVAREAKAASETTETRLMWGRIFPEGTEAVIRKRLAGENISRGDIHRAGYPEMSQAERNAIGDALVQDVAEFIRRNRQPRPAQIPEKTLSGQPEAAKPVIEAKIDPHGPNFSPETGAEAPAGAEKPVQPPEVAANPARGASVEGNPTNDTPPAPSAPTPVPVRPTASSSEAAPKKTAVEEYEGRLGAKTEDGRPVAPFTPGLRNGVGLSKDFRDKRLAEMGTDFEHATDEQLQQITNEKNEIEKRHNKIEKDWYASLPDGTTVYPGEGQAGGAIMKVDGKWYNLTSEGTLDHQQLDHNGKPIGKPYRVEHDIGSITTPIPESSRVELPKSNGNPVADVPDEAAAKHLTPKGALKDGYVGAKPGETIKVGDFKYTVTSRDEENGTLTVTNPKTGGVYEINEQGEVKEVTNGQSGSGSPESAGPRAQETARIEAAQGNGEAGTDGNQGQADGGAPGAKGGGTDVGGVKPGTNEAKNSHQIVQNAQNKAVQTPDGQGKRASLSKTVTEVKPANTKADPKKVAKVAEKFNLHLTKAETEKMSRSKNGINTNLMKTYHDPDGHLVATDGRILISTTHGFDKANADADKASGRTYPNWRHVVPDYDTLPNRSQVNPKTIIAVAKEATKLARDTGNNPDNVYVVVEVGDTSCLLAAKYAEKMAEAMDAAGMTELATDARDNSPVIAHDNTTDIVTMPVRMAEAGDRDIVIDAQTGRLVHAPKFDRDEKTGRLKEEDQLEVISNEAKEKRDEHLGVIRDSDALKYILDVRDGKKTAEEAAWESFEGSAKHDERLKNRTELFQRISDIKDDDKIIDALVEYDRKTRRHVNPTYYKFENDVSRLTKHVAAAKRIEELRDAEPEQLATEEKSAPAEKSVEPKPAAEKKPVEKPTEAAAPVEDAAYTKWLHGLPDTPERRAEYEKSHKAEDNSTVENRAQTSDYHDATDIKRKYVDHVQFSNPLVGKNGAKLVSYSWKNKKEEYVDNQGEDRVRKVSDWEESLKNEDTNRDIVHHFDIVDADGNLHTVSLDTAAKMLGLDVGKVRGEALAQMRKAVKLSDISDEQRKSVERVLKRSSSQNGSVGMPFYKDGDSVSVMRDGSIRIMGPRGKSDGVYDRWRWSVVTIDKNGKVNESRLAAKPNTKGFEIEIEDISLKAEAPATADKPQGDGQLPTETAGGKIPANENAEAKPGESAERVVAGEAGLSRPVGAEGSGGKEPPAKGGEEVNKTTATYQSAVEAPFSTIITSADGKRYRKVPYGSSDNKYGRWMDVETNKLLDVKKDDFAKGKFTIDYSETMLGKKNESILFARTSYGEKPTATADTAREVRDAQNNLYRVRFSTAGKKREEQARAAFDEAVAKFKKSIEDEAVSLEDLKAEAKKFDEEEQKFRDSDVGTSQHHNWAISNAIRDEIARREGTEPPPHRDEWHPQGVKPEDPWMKSAREDKDAVALNKKYRSAKTDEERQALRAEFDKIVARHKAEWEKENANQEPEQASRTPEEVAAAKKQFVDAAYGYYREEGSVRAGSSAIARMEHKAAISRVQAELKSETDAMEKARDAGTQAEFDKHSDRVEELKDALEVLNKMKWEVEDLENADSKSESHANLRNLLKTINDVSPIPNYEDIGPYSRRDAKRSGVKIIDDANDDIDDTIGRIEKSGRRFEEDDDLIFDAAERYLDNEFEFSKDVYDKLTDGDRKYFDKLVREAAEAKKEVIDTIAEDDEVPSALSKKFVDAHEAIGAFEESARKYHGLMRDEDGHAVIYTEKAHATEMAADAVASSAKALAKLDQTAGEAAMERMRLAVNNGGDFPNRKAVNEIAKELPENMRKPFVKNMNEWRKWAEERASDVRNHVSRLSTSLIDPDFTAWAEKQGVKPDAKQRQTYDRIQSEKAVKMLRRFIPNVKVEFADRPKDVNADPEVRASRITPAEDVAYMDTVKRGDMETAQRMVDDFARESGYDTSRPVYHAGTLGVKQDALSKPYIFIADGEGFHVGTLKAATERFSDDISFDDNFDISHRKTKDGKYVGQYTVNGEVVMETDKSYDDPNDADWNASVKLHDLLGEEGTAKKIIGAGGAMKLHKLYLRSGMKLKRQSDIIDRHAASWEKDIEAAKAGGYDGIEYVNSGEDKGSTSYVIWNNADAKSADPVTNDNAGNVIPLSQRFNAQNDDIRYLHDRSTGAVVGTYDRLTNKVTLYPGANLETVMHEMGGHALWQYAEQHPELKLKEKLTAYADEAPQELKDAIAADYAEDGLSPEALLDEIFSGRFGREKSGKVADALRREAGRKWYQKVWDAIKGAWRAVVSRFGGNKIDTDALDGMTPDEAVEYMASQMVAGKTLGSVAPSRRAAESAPTAKDTPYITQKASGGKVHELLQSYLARRDDADSAGEVRKSVGGEPAGNAEAELLSLARENGVHLGGVEEVRAKVSGEPFADGQVDKHGMETISVKRDGDKVVKLRIADNSTDHENEKVAYHNELFPDTKYTIRGFAEDANGDPVTVLEQRYVEFEPNSGERARKALLDELRERFGSAEMRGNEIHAGGWAIDDLKDANVGIDAKTGKPAVIDCIIHRVDELPKNLRWESDKSGGEVRYARGGSPSPAPAVKPVFDDPQSKAKNTREMFQDSRIKVRDFEEKVGITDKKDSAYHAADRKNGLIEHQFSKLERDFVAPILRSLAKQGIDPATFDRYLVAEHAAERNAVVASRGGGQGASMTDAEAQQFLDDLRARGEYDKYHAIGEKVWAMNQEALDRALSSGRISQQYHDQLTNQWSHYVPLRFDMENEELDTFNRSIGGWRKDEYAKAKGHTEEEDSPLIFSFMQAEQSIKAANENIVRQKVAENFETAAKRGFDAGKIYKGRQMKKTWAFDVGKDVIIADEGFNERDRDDLIFFKRDGDLYAVVVNPGKHGGGLDYARAITGKNMPQLGAFWRGVRSFTQWKARMRTSLVPTFIGRNFKNDTFETQRHLDMDFGVVEGKKIMASVAKWEVKNAPAVMAYAKDGKLTGGYVQEYVENGGLIGGGVASNYADQARRIRKDIGYYSKHGLAVSAFREAMKGIQVLNELAENSTRIGVYSALRERGMSVEDAISWARDNTGNFNRKGTKSDYTNSLWMFSNAAVQGHARDFHAYKNAAKNGHLVSNLLQTALIGVTEALLAHYFGNDEEREKAGGPNAKNETEYDKATKISIPIGGGRKIQWGMRGMGAVEIYVARKLAEVVLGDSNPLDTAVELAKYAGDQLTSVVGGNGLDSPSKAAQTVSPAHTDMLVQMALGKDYKDDDLYRRKFNEYDPDSWNGSRKTPEIYAKVAQALNAITGGNEHRKGKVDLAPETIKLFAEELGGGVMRDIDTAYQAIKGAVDTAKGDAPDDLVGSIPFVRDTVRKYPSVSGRFWEAYDRYKADKNEYDGTTDAGHKRELVKEHPYLRKVDGKTEIDRLFKIHQALQEHLDGFMRVDGKKREHEYTPKQKSEFRDKMRRVEAQILKLLGD